MKLKIPKLFLITFIFYFVIDPLRLVMKNGGEVFIAFAQSSFFLYLAVTSFMTFSIFSLSSYLGIFFFKKKQWYFLILSLLAGFFIGSVIRFLLQQKLSILLFDGTNYDPNISLENFIKDQFYYAILYFIVGFVFYLYQYGKHKEKRESELVLQNQKMELSLLRSQINPHFLLNSMNNIYSLVSIESDNALPAIDKLSNILKYTLYEGREMVNLEEEINYINDYIALQSLRFSNKPFIETNFNKDTYGISIPQFILVPLIENAFKHGNLKSKEEPLILSSSLINNKVQLKVKNKIGNTINKDAIGGIGLENIKKRLELLYGENHSFQIDSNDNTFSVTISIPLK